MADAQALLRAGDGAPYADFLTGFIAGLNDLDGLDRRQPCGAILFFDPARPEADPAPVVCLPVTDLAALQATLASTGNAVVATEDPRRYTLRLGKDELALTLVGGYALVTNPAHAPPDYSSADALALLGPAEPEADVVLKLRRAGVPPLAIAKALAELSRDAERELQPREHETDEEFRLRADFQRSISDGLALVIQEGEELTVAATLADDLQLAVAVEFQAAAGGALQAGMAETLKSPRRLPTPLIPPPALQFHAGWSLSGRGREIARRALGLARRQVLQEVGQSIPVDVGEQIERAFAALDATAAAGVLELQAAFLPTPSGRFVLLAGAAAAQPESLDGAVRALVPLALAARDLEHAEMDAFRIGDLAFHRLQGRDIRDRDRKLYGPDLALYLAAGRGAFWFVLGGGETPAVLETALSPQAEARPSPAAARLDLRITPWAELAAREGGESGREVFNLVRDTLTDNSGLAAVLQTTATGAKLSLQVDPGSVRLLSRIAILRARQK